MDIYHLKKDYVKLQDNYSNLVTKDNYKNYEQKLETLSQAVNKPDFWDDANKASSINKELASVQKIVNLKEEVSSLVQDFDTLLELHKEESVNDKELELEYNKLLKEYSQLEMNLLLSGKYDMNDCLLEINSGAGGTESQDWANMLMDMYIKYANSHDYKVNVLSINYGEVAGIKSCLLEIKGDMMYGFLKRESGIHRLVRLSPFNSNNKRHTSFAAIKVSPLIEDDINIEIVDSDLKIDTFRSSGAGGQSVNTTDSAVRITHLPTGIVVTCQNERSQQSNKQTALKILKIRLYELEEEKRNKLKDESNSNDSDISFGSQKRSYTLNPYKLIKDHDSKYESGNVEKVLNGYIDEFLYKNLV
ncbi:MAG: peptide chain release factor 2 [Mycoplasmatales bacterium]